MEDTTTMKVSALGWPRLVRFDTSEALEIYVETQLNEKGHDPTVALIDSAGTQTTAHRTAPGGDGYGFEYAIGDREPVAGGRHCCWCSDCGVTCANTISNRAWSPAFPVWIMEPVR
jgi:hypothetical protein